MRRGRLVGGLGGPLVEYASFVEDDPEGGQIFQRWVGRAHDQPAARGEALEKPPGHVADRFCGEVEQDVAAQEQVHAPGAGGERRVDVQGQVQVIEVNAVAEPFVEDKQVAAGGQV